MELIKEKSYGDTNFITGMRAFAAFAVLFIHSGGAGLREFGLIANQFVDFGRTGVYAFFVISGFSIATSYQSSSGYFQYLNRRMWRIAPIYYFWIVVSIIIGVAPFAVNAESAVAVDARNLWMHAFFLGFLDYKITNSLLGVEWSISIEVFWYIVMPLLFLVIRGRVLVVVAIVTSFYWYRKFNQDPTYLPWVTDNPGLAMHWSPLPYVASYCLGVGAFRLREAMPGIRKHANAAFVVVILLCAAFIAFRDVMIKITYDDVLFSSTVTAILIVFGSQSSAMYRWVFGNRLAVFLGTISYGIYLPQFLLLALLTKLLPPDTFVIFVVLCLSSVAVSYVIYRLIELPTLNFGTRLGKKLAFTGRWQTS